MVEASGLTIAPAASRAIFGISAFRDHATLKQALRAEFGISLPDMPGFVLAGAITFACIGPARYLASADKTASLRERLAGVCNGLAAMTDQSDLWKIFVISGPRAREVLSRVVPIDLHPSKFRCGKMALTRGGHLDVRLFQTGETEYELAIARSYAADLQHALHAAAHDCR